MTAHKPRTALLALLKKRAAHQTVCPSEVARSLAREAGTPTAWRDLMPSVHAAVDELAADGAVELSWKGKSLDERAGPYRIRRPR